MIRTFPPPVPGMEGFRFRVATRSCGGPRYRTARAFELSKCGLHYQTQQHTINCTSYGHCMACHAEGGEAIFCHLRLPVHAKCRATLHPRHPRFFAVRRTLWEKPNNRTTPPDDTTTTADKHDELTLDARSYVLEGNCAVYKVQHNGS